MSDSNLTLPTETEKQARDRMAAQLERDADLIANATGVQLAFRDETVRELRRRAAALRGGK